MKEIKVQKTSIHSIDHLTKKKKKEIWILKNEYVAISNKFIYLYDNAVRNGEMTLMGKSDGTKLGALRESTVNKIIKMMPFKVTSRFAKNAIAYAFRAIKAQVEQCKESGKKYVRPKMNPSFIELNEDIATFIPIKKNNLKEFDGLIKLSSTGKKAIFIPYKETKFSNKLSNIFEKRNKTIQLGSTLNISYSSPQPKKEDNGEVVSIDLNCSDDLISTSTREHFGTEIRSYINSLNNKKQYSNGWYQSQRALYHYIDKTINDFFNAHPKMVWLIMENLKSVKNKMKVNGKLNKFSRKVIGNWYYAYVIKKLEERCNLNCIHFRKLPSFYLSQKCSSCGFVSKKNRTSTSRFHCVGDKPDGTPCNHSDHSGFNSCDNLLILFLKIGRAHV